VFDKIRLADLAADLGILLSPVCAIVISYWTVDLEIMEALVLKYLQINFRLSGDLFPDSHSRDISLNIYDLQGITLCISSPISRIEIANIELLAELLMIPKLDGAGKEYPPGVDQITGICISKLRKEIYGDLRDPNIVFMRAHGIKFSPHDLRYIYRFSEDRLKMDKYFVERIMAGINIFPAKEQDIVISYWVEDIRILNASDGLFNILIPGDKFRDNATRGVVLDTRYGWRLEIYGGVHFSISNSRVFTSLFILPRFGLAGDTEPAEDYDDTNRLCFTTLRDNLYKSIGS
jgi:hypothetical protein